MELKVYRNSEIIDEGHYPEPVAIMEGETNEECEAKAGEEWDSNDYTFSYC